jgi:hypothetical protein
MSSTPSRFATPCSGSLSSSCTRHCGAVHPEDFLLDLHDLAPEAVRAALEQQAADLHPPWPLEQLLEALATAGVPRFVATVRSQT